MYMCVLHSINDLDYCSMLSLLSITHLLTNYLNVNKKKSIKIIFPIAKVEAGLCHHAT